MNEDLGTLAGDIVRMNTNKEVKTIDEPTETLDGKIKTSEIMIIVGGSADKPYYSIRYYDLLDKSWHVGFSSYCLSYVMDWKKLYFELVEPVEPVEPVEHVESAKHMETERNWEAEYKRLKNEADVMYKQLDQAQKELNDQNRELTRLKEKLYDLRRDKEYVDGKTYAYELALRYLGTEKKG